MLIHPTIERLQALHLAAMAQAFDQQRGSSQHADLHFEDRVGLLVEAEWTAREQRRLTQRLRHAKLRYPACLEDVDFTTPRGLTRDVILSLGTGAWIRERQNLLITGPTGIGKSWLASAFVAECVSARLDRDLRPRPAPAPRPGRQSRRRLLRPAACQARETATCSRLTTGSWPRSPKLNAATSSKSSKIGANASRPSLPVNSRPTAWHAAIGEPTVADAICDRLIHRAHKLTLKGPTMRDPVHDATEKPNREPPSCGPRRPACGSRPSCGKRRACFPQARWTRTERAPTRSTGIVH